MMRKHGSEILDELGRLESRFADALAYVKIRGIGEELLNRLEKAKEVIDEVGEEVDRFMAEGL